MNLHILKRAAPPRHSEAKPPATGGNEGTPPKPPAAAVERSVLVHHGIHSGHFPVAGLRVRDARATLTPLLNIDPQAVAVINGRIVSEDQIIAEDVALLSFVKPSAVKG
ncbi:MAG TPA: hypothetical protein VG013_02130 [Gemmataceae bacterium]|jgi:hypothetical protein|nr:hypothetical protein [Gemmataceae bacterium]